MIKKFNKIIGFYFKIIFLFIFYLTLNAEYPETSIGVIDLNYIFIR